MTRHFSPGYGTQWREPRFSHGFCLRWMVSSATVGHAMGFRQTSSSIYRCLIRLHLCSITFGDVLRHSIVRCSRLTNEHASII